MSGGVVHSDWKYLYILIVRTKRVGKGTDEREREIARRNGGRGRDRSEGRKDMGEKRWEGRNTDDGGDEAMKGCHGG